MDVASQGVEKTYFEFLARKEWRIQRCAACSRFIFYPRQLCPFCGADEFDWIEPSGAGSVYSISTVHAGTDPLDHYNVALIDLDEGVRMMSRVEGVDAADVTIGSRVRSMIVTDAKSGANVVVFEAEERAR